MKELLNYMNLLKTGASKENYPMYAQLLHIDDSFVSTCNDEAFVRINIPMPFKGNVNLFVLENALKTISEDYSIAEERDGIMIFSKNSEYHLISMDIDFPNFGRASAGSLVLDEGLIEVLKLALSFTGKYEYESVYIDDKGILATDQERVLDYNHNLNLEKPMMLSRAIINILEPNFKIGVEDNDNAVVKFENGFALFTVPHYAHFPADKIRPFIDKEMYEVQKLVEVSEFKTLLAKISPIFFGEKKRMFNITVQNSILRVDGQSPFNGKASAEMHVNLPFDWDTYIDFDLFGSIPDNFTLSVKENSKNLTASNGITDIIIVGH